MGDESRFVNIKLVQEKLDEHEDCFGDEYGNYNADCELIEEMRVLLRRKSITREEMLLNPPITIPTAEVTNDNVKVDGTEFRF